MSDNAPIQPPVPDADAIKAWLDYQYAELIAEMDECRRALQSIIDKYPDGLTDDAAGIAGQNLAIVAAKLKAADDRRKEENKPYRDGHKAVNDWFEDFVFTPVMIAKNAVHAMQNRHGMEVRRREQEKADEALRLAREEAARKAAEAAQALREQRPDAIGQMEQAGRAAEELTRAAEKSDNVIARVHGPMGSISSGAVTWSWEVEDFSAVPDFYKCIDEAKVREAAKKRGARNKPTAVIPGIKWVEKFSMRNR